MHALKTVLVFGSHLEKVEGGSRATLTWVTTVKMPLHVVHCVWPLHVPSPGDYLGKI